MADTRQRNNIPRRERLSVVIPVYNERDTIELLLERVRQVPVDKEIIVVDDGSTDGTARILTELADLGEIDRLIQHPVNRGKGAALQSGFREASGDWVVVQDADLEYDPQEIVELLAPVRDGRADVVFGSRFVGSGPHRVLFFWHYVANRLLTIVSNMFTNLNLTDMETCYKLFRSDILDQFELKECRFGVEPEITAKISKIRGIRIYEVGITYSGRTYADGKKIGYRDAFRALWCIFRYNLLPS